MVGGGGGVLVILYAIEYITRLLLSAVLSSILPDKQCGLKGSLICAYTTCHNSISSHQQMTQQTS